MSENVGRIHKGELAAIEALLRGGSFGQAAKAAGISERTLLRWRQGEGFRARLADARREMFGQALIALHNISRRAVAVLNEVLNSKTASDRDKILAARIALDAGFRATEAVDVLARIDALERQYSEAGCK